MAAAEPVSIAILAKAPVAGFAKTRLIPALGAGRAARLQARLTDRTVETACAAATGPVTVWATPDETHADVPDAAHPSQRGARAPARRRSRRAHAWRRSRRSGGPTLVIGTDCPAMMPAHLRKAADVLRGGADAVVCPAEDGGYVLIGMHKPLPALFAGMSWSTSGVMEETRRRLRYHRLDLAGAGDAVGRGRAGGPAAAARPRPAGRIFARISA